MAKAGAASKEFARIWSRGAKAEAAIVRELNRRAAYFYAKKNVIGFGTGLKNNQPAAVFFVTRRQSRSKLKPKDRLPRWLLVSKKRVSTDVIAVGRTKLLAAIGDPTENQKSYHAGGAGQWKMGTEIRVFSPCKANPATDPKLITIGTSGALVRKSKNEPPLMMSCAHILLLDDFDVAQAKEDRIPPCVGAANLKNFAGGVRQVADLNDADAGIVECADALPEILHIGKYKPQQDPKVGLRVEKSGRTTGLTWSKIANKNVSLKAPLKGVLAKLFGDEVTYNGLFAIAGRGLPENRWMSPKRPMISITGASRTWMTPMIRQTPPARRISTTNGRTRRWAFR